MGEERRTGPIQSKGALKALLGRNVPGPNVKGRWSSYTHVITCRLCGNQVTTRDWVWGLRKFTATICQPCADRWDARRGDYPAAPAPEKCKIRSPLPDEPD
jgi:hypothetical protein